MQNKSEILQWQISIGSLSNRSFSVFRVTHQLYNTVARLAGRLAVLHAVPSLDPAQGGPSRTVVALADALARQAGCRVGLVSQGRRGAATVALAEAAVASSIGERRRP